MLNIPFDTLVYCEHVGLEAWSAGGGCDYIGIIDRATGVTFQITEKNQNRADDLNSPAEILVFDGIDFSSCLCLDFNSTKQAIDAVSSPEFRTIALNLFADRIEPISVDRQKRCKTISSIDDQLNAEMAGLGFDEYLALTFSTTNSKFKLI